MILRGQDACPLDLRSTNSQFLYTLGKLASEGFGKGPGPVVQVEDGKAARRVSLMLATDWHMTRTSDINNNDKSS